MTDIYYIDSIVMSNDFSFYVPFNKSYDSKSTYSYIYQICLF